MATRKSTVSWDEWKKNKKTIVDELLKPSKKEEEDAKKRAQEEMNRRTQISSRVNAATEAYRNVARENNKILTRDAMERKRNTSIPVYNVNLSGVLPLNRKTTSKIDDLLNMKSSAGRAAMQHQQNLNAARLEKDPGYRIVTEPADVIQKRTKQIAPGTYVTQPAEVNSRAVLEEITEEEFRTGKKKEEPEKEVKYRELTRPYNEVAAEQKMAKRAQKKTTQQEMTDWNNLLEIIRKGQSNPVDNPRDYAEEQRLLNQYGLGDPGSVYNMNLQQLEEGIQNNQRKLNEAREKRYQNALRPKEELDAELATATENKGKYNTLAYYGLPTWRKEGGTVDFKDWRENNSTEYNYIKERPEDYEGNEYQYDTMLYDWLYGQGAYEERVWNIEDDAEAEELDQEMDQLWSSLEDGSIKQKLEEAEEEYAEALKARSGIYTGSNQENVWQKNIQNYQEEKARRDIIARMEAEAPAGDGSYKEVSQRTAFSDPASRILAPQVIPFDITEGDEVDRLSKRINELQDPTERSFFGAALNGSDPEKLAELDPAFFMDEEQVKTFNNYINANMKKEAQAYYEALEPALNSMYQSARTQLVERMSTNEWGPLMTAERVFTQPVAGALGTIGAIGALMGNKGMQNPDSEWYTLTKTNQTIQGTQAKEMGKKFAKWFGGGDEGIAAKAGELLTNTMFSIADNITSMAIGMGAGKAISGTTTGKLATAAVQLVMSNEATASEMVEQLEKGKQPSEAALLALGGGIVEAVTEKYSIEAFFNKKNLPAMKNLLANWFTEGTEEVASDLLNAALDELVSRAYGHKGELTQKYEDLCKTMTAQEASRKVLGDFLGDIGVSFISGSMAGLVMGGGSQLLTQAQNVRTGKAINDKINIRDGKTGAEQLISVAKGMEGTNAQKLAITLDKAIQGGEKPGNYSIGKLASTMIQDMGQQHDTVIPETIRRTVQQQLEAAGVKRGLAQSVAQVMTNSIVEGKALSKEDISLLAQDRRAMDLWKSYSSIMSEESAELRKNISEITDKEKSVATLIGDLTGTTAKSTSPLAADIDRANRDAADNVSAVDNLFKARKDLLSERYVESVKGILQKDAGAAASKTLLDDVMTIRLAAFSMEKNAPRTNLSSEATQELFEDAKAEFEELEDGRVVQQEGKDANGQKITGQKKIIPGQGKATYKGTAAYGTQAWHDAINGDKSLTKTQKTYMRVTAEVARRMGMNVNFINDSETRKDGTSGKDIFGWEDRETGKITINVAGMDARGTAHNLLVTLPHEMTHWLEQNSREGYKALRQFVFDDLRAKGEDVGKILVNSIGNQNTVLGAESGEGLDLYGAVAELVARGSEGLFTSTEMRNRLQQQNPGVFNTIKSFVKEFINKFNQAIKSIPASMSREANVLQNQVDQIAKIWLEGYDEATGRSAEGAAAEERISWSTAMREEARAIQQIQDPDERISRASKYMQDSLDWQLKQNRIEQEGNKYVNGMLFVEKITPKKAAELKKEEARLLEAKERYANLKPGSEEERFVNAWLDLNETRDTNERKNLKESAEKMLLDRIEKAGGIPYKAPEYYFGNHNQWIAKLIKEKEPMAVAEAAWLMSEMVPSNAVLIPMPNHFGVVNDDTDTMVLARAISRITGNPVVNALAGVAREKRQNTKEKTRGKQLIAEDMGFRQVAEIPEGMIPYFVDNLIASGETAKAAHAAFGKGVTIAYAKTTRGAIDGMKRADLTTYDKGKYGQYLIPLDERANMEKTGFEGTKYSTRQDQDYMSAVENGDMETAQRMVDEAAEEEGYTIRGTHRTNAKFHVFEKSKQTGKNGKTLGDGFYIAAGTGTEYDNDTYGKNRMLVRVNPGNVFRIADGLTKQQANRIYNKYFKPFHDDKFNIYRPHVIEKLQSPTRLMDYIKEAAETNNTTTDAIFKWLGYDSIKDGPQYAIFDSERIKLADPVTYDDNGDVIPLSQRFNTGNEDIRYSVKEMMKKSWEEQIDRVETGESYKNDALVIIKEGEMSKYGIDGMIVLTQSNYRKARREKRGNSKSAHGISVPTMKKLKEAIMNPVAKIISDSGIVLITELQDQEEKYIIVPIVENRNFGKNVWEAKSIYGRENMMTLYAKREEDGSYTPKNNTKIELYKKNASEILRTGPKQYGAPQNIESVIETLTQNETENNREKEFSVQQNEIRNDDGELLAEELPGGTITKYSLRSWNEEYLDAVKNGNMQTAQEMINAAAEAAGYTIRAYHGTGRADRVGTVFRPDRATSGPMAFFTDNREIAENYSKSKQDTSIAYDEEYGDYHTQFRYTLNGKNIPVSKLWDKLDWKSRQKVIEAAKHINFDEDLEEIIYDPDAKYGPGGFTENELRYHKGNAIDTLIYVWLDSANLWNREQDFLKVLQLAGINNVTWNNPDARYEKVYDTYLKIQNPFDTGSMYTEEFLDDLKEWWDDQDQDKYTKESMDSDMWDKNNVTVDEWADFGYEDIKNGHTHNWTRIPDGVTDYLKSKGFDGIKDTGGKNGGETHTVWIPFASEQVKSAEPVTYDNDGNVIPPSERFNKEKPDIRFSTKQPDMDVNQFMMGLNEASLKTEQEKSMLRQYKNLRMAMDVARLSLTENTRRLRELEKKEKPSAFDREEMQKARNRIENDNNKISRLEAQLIKATTGEGYAALMKSQSRIVNDLVNGRTVDDVRATVEALTKDLDRMTAEMGKREAEIRDMRNDLAIRKQSTLVDEKSAEIVANYIRSEYKTKLPKKELISDLIRIRLKMVAGTDISEDLDNLAWKIAKKTEGEGSVYLNELRGRTILLGEGQMAELKARNESLPAIRKELAGTGIEIRAAKAGEKGLDNDWNELCDMIPSLHQDTGEKDQLDELLGVIRSEKKLLTAEDQYEGYIEEVSNDLKATAATISMHVPNDPAAMAILKKMDTIVNDLASGITRSAEEIRKTKEEVLQLIRDGKLAMSKADSLQGDVDKMIAYNNALARQSEQAMWKEEKWKLREQLKAENTQNLLKEQAKWKARIEKDKTAREMMATNQQLRKMIHTNVSRIRKLLINETDLKNIPEHMKGLAREMLGMIVNNDLTGRKISGINRMDLLETRRILDIMNEQDGEFTEDDLRLITDEEAQSMVLEALADLEDGIKFYNASAGGDILTNLQAFRNALERIQEAVTTITNVIHAEQSINLADRRIAVADAAEEVAYQMRRSRFKGERIGRGSSKLNGARNMIVTGNTTPVYFFKNLLNSGMMKLWGEFQRGQNRNGLETQKAQDFVHGLAEKTHFKDWAGQTHKVRLGSHEVEMTVGNIMSLYAIWRREQTINPEMSEHLTKGGIYIERNERNEGKLRTEKDSTRAIRVRDADVLRAYNLLTVEQQQYLDAMVGYLSNEMSDLGNEASMRMYGIKKYKEKWYFPMKVWDGVKSARSDRGITGQNENRAASKSWTKRRKHMAQNALVIGDFTETAVGHIVEMINYNTMAPAIENMNKVLNYQHTEFEQDEAGEDASTKRNVRVMFQEAYGRAALKYLETFMSDLNGGPVQDQRKSLRDILIGTFRKNAVSGSLSVALQQPLSYIRAAMMINPKYLAAALNPVYWKGSHEEMTKYSGVAVLKDMGRFDMNYGASARSYIMPENKKTYEKVSDALTILPEMMDRMTWTRMWSAVKMEQHAQHPEMDIHSDEFLKMVAERFNEVMERTQVFDSVLVKSQNMRSQKLSMKLMTSFMAEPTLTLNVLADAVRNAKEKGGMATLRKAGATFILSAILQAMVKAAVGSGRTPDEKKTWLENFLYKWESSFISEANPLGLIPGYSDLIEVLKNGELKDDAMGVLGKLFTAQDKLNDMLTNGKWGDYRAWEDSVGQIAQLFTNIPAKNLMRDARAMYNWISGAPYAKRDTSAAVLRKQTEAALLTADNLLGAINAKLGEAGFRTTNKAYIGRMFDAMQSGNSAEAEEIREYITLAKGVKDTAISSGLKAQAKEKLAPAEASQWMIDNDLMDSTSTLTTQYKDGEITRDEYSKLLKQADENLTDNDIWWKIDRIDYQKETGNEVSGSSYYYRLTDAVNNNKAEEIRKAVDQLLKHGITKEKIKGKLSDWKSEYLEADSVGKIKIRDALEKAYRAAGYTAEDAQKTISKWK